MKRAENCVNAKINHIKFEDDSLVFSFAKSKGHQNGEEHVGPWHVYSNPLEPHICPVLALARYIFAFPEVLSSNSSLFQGKSQYNRYSKLFLAFVKENMHELRPLGVEEGDLGTHSCRKGVATMVASGCTVSPPIVSLCIRCGWVMGGVKDRYLKYEGAGDQYVGKCACGLDQLTKEFAISPAYFDYSHIEDEVDRLATKRKVTAWLEARLTDKGNISPETFHMIVMAFASLCYHRKYLETNLAQESCLRASSFFKDVPEYILECAQVRLPWKKTEYTPKATGIPPHVLVMAQFEELKEKFDALRAGITGDIASMMDERGVGGSEFHTNSILNAIATSQQKIDDILLMSRTRQDPSTDMAEPEDSNNDFIIEDEGEIETANMDDAEVERSREEQCVIQQRVARASMQAVRKRQLRLGFHHGKLQCLPAHWKFPRMTCKQLFENWFLGNKRDNIPPLALLKHHHVEHIKNGAPTLRKMKAFLKIAEKYARDEGCWFESRADWSIDKVREAWEKIGDKHIQAKFGGKTSSRKREISWATAIHYMTGARAFRSNG